MLKINSIHCVDILDGLKKLPDESIDMVITSPPYWNMRDYGAVTETIWDTAPDCRHRFSKKNIRKHTGGGGKSAVAHHRKGVSQFTTSSKFCTKCGAWKGQLGQEPDFHLYVKHLLDIFDEIKRVLKKEGTCWVNMGDTYGTNALNMPGRNRCAVANRPKSLGYACLRTSSWGKCMLGIPERFTLGMIDRGWILRNKIIWHKPNHVPSPVKDRFTNTWEYFYMFSKSKRYYFDLDAVRIPHRRPTPAAKADYQRMIQRRQELEGRRRPAGVKNSLFAGHPNGKNPGDLLEAEDYWSIASRPFRGAHFAVFPEQLIERPILAGCPGQVCKKCGLPKLKRIEGGNPNAFNIRVRDVKKGRIKHSDRKASKKEINSYNEKDCVSDLRTKTIFECKCNAGFVPGVVLDPFMGSGTTAVVSRKFGRAFIGFELNPEYVKIAGKRLKKNKQPAVAGIA